MSIGRVMATTDASDGHLVRQARAGRANALAVLISRHWSVVHKLLARATGSWIEAEDLAQETVLQAATRLSDLQEPERFGPWLYTIALNRARLWWRRRRTSRVPQSLEALLANAPTAVEPHLAGESTSPEAAWEAADLARTIGRALSALPKPQQQAILAHYVEGLTYGEIATMLSVPPSTVRSRLQHARERLRRELAPLVAEGYAEFARPPYAPSSSARARSLAMAYVEMTVDSVHVAGGGRPGARYEPAGRAVVLKRVDSPAAGAGVPAKPDKRYLAVVVAPYELDVVTVARRPATPRPLTHRLMLELATAGNATIQEVRLTGVQDDMLSSTIVLKLGRRTKQVKARPTDAIVLALQAEVPIYAHTAVLEQAGITSPDAWEERLQHTRAALKRLLGGRPGGVTMGGARVWMLDTVRLAERAVALAERWGHQRLGTGHVLLAMVDLAEAEPDHDLASLFKEDGVDIAMVRQAVEAAVENELDLLEIARVADRT